MTLAATTISDIILNADEDDLDRIFQTVKDRRKTLASARSATIQIGAKVVLTGLTPKYLNGLTGIVVRDPAGRSGVRAFGCKLDEESTNRLRFAGTRFRIPSGTTEYTVSGVPVQCFRISA